MKRITLAEIKNLDWKPRTIREINGIKYGYYKAKHPYLQFPDPDVIIDFVRVPSGMVIPAHYHNDATERFTVPEGSAKFQIGMRMDALDEEIVYAGDMLAIDPHEIHRVDNNSPVDLYLVRFALNKQEEDTIYTEPGF